jgi:hypothetical protein
MISLLAEHAQSLYRQPPYTDDDVEDQIRKRAASDRYTCFERNRISDAQLDALRNNGFAVSLSGDSVHVSWVSGDNK